jgi:thiol-disulfide isomerase/thioredoxin
MNEGERMNPRSSLRLAPALAAAASLSLFAVGTNAAPAKVAPVDAAALKRAVAARKGKVVVVNYWATWCAPCVKEFPALVRVRDKYKAQGLDLMTVSVDTPGDVAPKVAPFLAKHRASGGAYVVKGKTDTFIQAMDRDWQGDVPRTYIYGRNGKLAKVLTGEQSEAAFAAAVRPLLAAKR